jgi:hypothetical protein
VRSSRSCSLLNLLVVLIELLLNRSGRAEELFNLLVQSGQFVLLLVVVRDQALLLSKQSLTLLFQSLAFGVFVVDASYHEVVFVCASKLRIGSEDLVDGNQR